MPNPLQSDLEHVLDATRPLWDELRGGRLFITGGTGFFGCWLLETFCWACDELDLRAEALVLTRNPDAFVRKAPHLAAHPAVRLMPGDVRTFEFPRGEFSHIVHAATDSAASNVAPSDMLETVVEGTRHTLAFARHCGAAKFLLTSSGAVYGAQPAELTHVSEEYRGAPDTTDIRFAYGEGKRMAEMLCAIDAERFALQAKIARCFAFVGPYQPLDAHFAIGNFIRDALSGGPIEVRGDGSPYRSYLYAADLAIWLWTILFRGATARPYNVGSAADLTIEELAREVAAVVGNDVRDKQIDVHVHREFVPGARVERYVPEISRAAHDLGLEVRVDRREAILRTAVWNRIATGSAAGTKPVHS